MHPCFFIFFMNVFSVCLLLPSGLEMHVECMQRLSFEIIMYGYHM
jgi:hypothetical protein